MKTQRAVGRVLTLVGIGMGLAGTGSAADMVYSGRLCNPARLDVSKIDYNSRGAFNVAPMSATVNCGGIIPFRSAVQVVQVIVYDRNPVENVVCTLSLTDIYGNPTAWPPPKASTGSAATPQVLQFYTPGVAQSVSLQCVLPAATSEGSSQLTTYSILTP